MKKVHGKYNNISVRCSYAHFLHSIYHTREGMQNHLTVRFFLVAIVYVSYTITGRRSKHFFMVVTMTFPGTCSNLTSLARNAKSASLFSSLRRNPLQSDGMSPLGVTFTFCPCPLFSIVEAFKELSK